VPAIGDRDASRETSVDRRHEGDIRNAIEPPALMPKTRVPEVPVRVRSRQHTDAVAEPFIGAPARRDGRL
jgi:hypothetical protein